MADFGSFPGAFELGDVITEDISCPERGDEVIKLSFLAVGEGPIARAVGMTVAVSVSVRLAE